MPKDNLMYLGSHIRIMRKKCGLTQQTLADQCGLAVKTIQDIENGRKNPSYETLSLLIDRLGISPNSLFPSKASPENELVEYVIGKLRLCNKENQKILLSTIAFLAEEYLSAKKKLNRILLNETSKTRISCYCWFFFKNYLCTLAPAPPMMDSTSFLLAIVVSPGVVIACAP